MKTLCVTFAFTLALAGGVRAADIDVGIEGPDHRVSAAGFGKRGTARLNLRGERGDVMFVAGPCARPGATTLDAWTYGRRRVIVAPCP